jgi:hypothetical protein
VIYGAIVTTDSFPGFLVVQSRQLFPQIRSKEVAVFVVLSMIRLRTFKEMNQIYVKKLNSAGGEKGTQRRVFRIFRKL